MSDKISEVVAAKKEVRARYTDAYCDCISISTGKVFVIYADRGSICVSDDCHTVDAAWQDAASKLTPAAVAGDAVKVEWRVEWMDEFDNWKFILGVGTEAQGNKIVRGATSKGMRLVKITTIEEIVESRNV